jgi:peroxiredoxin-like protein
MSTVKTFRFPASVQWRGDRLTHATVPGKHALDVATPPEFKGGRPGVWSPEDLLVTAAASCFAVTLAAVAERSGVTLASLAVSAVGHVERAADGRFRFTVIELDVDVRADAEPARVERLAAKAEAVCIVSLALDVPVHVRLAQNAAAAA